MKITHRMEFEGEKDNNGILDTEFIPVPNEVIIYKGNKYQWLNTQDRKTILLENGDAEVTFFMKKYMKRIPTKSLNP